MLFSHLLYLVCHSGDGALDDVAKGVFSLQVKAPKKKCMNMYGVCIHTYIYIYMYTYVCIVIFMSLEMPESPMKLTVDNISIYQMEELLTLQILRMGASTFCAT
jgi:hypothetical protein